MGDNYCVCSEYLGDKKKCDDPVYGCGREVPRLVCPGNGLRHTWTAHAPLPPEALVCSNCNRIAFSVFRKNVKHLPGTGVECYQRIFNQIEQRVMFYLYPVTEPRNIHKAMKLIKQDRYEATRPKPIRGEDPNRDYGGWIGASLMEYYHDWNAELDCMDNFRFADMSNRKDMRRYRAKAANGCCGRIDQIVTVDGKKYMVGCNYGH